MTVLRRAVSRFRCRSDLYEMDLLIDINVDIYPMEVSGWLAAAVDVSSFSPSSKTPPHSLCNPR